jgi:hypothetical protein
MHNATHSITHNATHNINHEVEIYSVNYDEIKCYNFEDWKNNIISNINSLEGKFRQEEIINQYNQLDLKNLWSLPITINVSTGFYIRQLVNDIKKGEGLIKDNWIYIQERDVRIGRLQIFNNWSPHLVAKDNTVWMGLEYFCNEGDKLWSMKDEDFMKMAADELVKIGIIDANAVLDSTIVRVKKTYPAYTGSYSEFPKVIEYLNGIKNLYPIGRNGMHKYNNSDHSMLTAMVAVDNILSGRKDKTNLWAINTEDEYHETK